MSRQQKERREPFSDRVCLFIDNSYNLKATGSNSANGIIRVSSVLKRPDNVTVVLAPKYEMELTPGSQDVFLSISEPSLALRSFMATYNWKTRLIQIKSIYYTNAATSYLV
jgi:hypothetical protein